MTRRARSYQPNDTFAGHLYRHAAGWFAFLIDPAVHATNWLAEQALRPAVVNRKVWGGNRTLTGSQAQGIHTSIIQTCHKQHLSPFDFLSQSLRGLQPMILVR